MNKKENSMNKKNKSLYSKVISKPYKTTINYSDLLNAFEDKDIPEHNKCIVCNRYITINDIENKNYKKISKNKYQHINCFRRKENV